jgi:hypothetical protein
LGDVPAYFGFTKPRALAILLLLVGCMFVIFGSLPDEQESKVRIELTTSNLSGWHSSVELL